MKQLPTIVAAILGLAFFTFGLNFFLHFMPSPPAQEVGSPPAMFFGAIFITGFLTFVKVLEILGAILVVIPKTRNLGLLVLGPIVIGIIATNLFIIGGNAVLDPVLISLSVMSAYLLWHARVKFLNLLND